MNKAMVPQSSAASVGSGGGGSVGSGGNNSNNNNVNVPPRPHVPPGHASPIRIPHPHDVLSGRGGRINSHPGNVRFREMVDSYKREYLDPRTKKVEKARIAARIVNCVRTLDPSGRFLKEDPHTGLWMEIGDERAWKKAGQALRESAPEIRAERQAQLQILAGVPVGGSVGGGGGADSVATGGGCKGGGGGRRSHQRQADPPGPRHRPNPPEREGLARSSASRNGNGNNCDAELAPRQGNNCGRQGQIQGNNGFQGQMQQNNQIIDEDRELARMRLEYLQMQQLQQEQQRRMLQYQNQLQQQQQQHQAAGGGGGGNNGDGNQRRGSNGYNNTNNDKEYAEYLRMKQELLGSYRQQVHQSAHAQMATGMAGQIGGGGGGAQPRPSNNGRGYPDHRDIAAAIMDDGLLPVNAGFDIPALRGERGHPSSQQQQQYRQQQNQYASQRNNNNNNNNSYRDNYSAAHGQEAFDQHFNSCDKTVSTMSSFDAQSMDMSSLGGFSWRDQSNLNASGMISTGSTQMSSNRHNNFNGSGRSGGDHRGKGMSALERKLDKVNEAHRRQKMQAPQSQATRQEAAARQPHPQGGIVVATSGGGGNRARKQSQEPNNNMSSLNSFGFEAIEEDEASCKMSNLGLSGLSEMDNGLSGFSEMDMTFGSEALREEDEGDPKPRTAPENNGGGGGGTVRGKNIEGQRKRSGAGGAPAGVPASSVFDHSLTSTTSGASAMNEKGHPPEFGMEDFNESFKSMEMEDRARSSGGGGGASRRKRSSQQRERLPDPDGVVGDRGTRPGSEAPPSFSSSSSSRRKDPSGGRLPSIQSSRASNHGAGASDVRLSSSVAAASRRESVESMGMSDPDMMGNSGLGNSNNDFGVSFESLRSFQSQGSDASSWLNQYNSMENVGTDKNPWDDEDQASGGTSTSEISAPRMVMATGADAS